MGRVRPDGRESSFVPNARDALGRSCAGGHSDAADEAEQEL